MNANVEYNFHFQAKELYAAIRFAFRREFKMFPTANREAV